MTELPPAADAASARVGADVQRLLLRWAREAIAAAVGGAPAPRVREADLTDELRSPHAAFVTLTLDGRLRGCIGRLDYHRPLWENVLTAAAAAALDDPRFPPVSAEELEDLTIEISVLDVPVDLGDPGAFDPVRQGIIVERGFRRGLFLPGVGPDAGWDREQTLAAVCRKAGLPSGAWREPGARLQVFRTVAFSEAAAGTSHEVDAGPSAE